MEQQDLLPWKAERDGVAVQNFQVVDTVGCSGKVERAARTAATRRGNSGRCGVAGAVRQKRDCGDTSAGRYRVDLRRGRAAGAALRDSEHVARGVSGARRVD